MQIAKLVYQSSACACACACACAFALALAFGLAFAVACSLQPNQITQKPVISTEAAHSFTVSSAAEKSASLPIPFPSLIAPLPLPFAVSFALALAVAVAFAVILRACDFLVCHSERSEEPLYFSCSADNLSEK
jgi:hypothetical protein